MKRKIASSGCVLLLACCAALCAGAAEDARPSVELTATSTNLVVTEETTVTVKLWLPPLKADLADTPPVMTQRPPHVTAPFWEPKWKSASILTVPIIICFNVDNTYYTCYYKTALRGVRYENIRDEEIA